MIAPNIGAPVKRSEDRRFLIGSGHYLDDLALPRQTHAWFVRSPHAHAKIKSIRTEAALAAPGVVAIFAGKDLVADKIGTLICGWVIKGKDGTAHKAPPHPALATDKVRYVGDHVAVVIADTLNAAKDAAELVEIDYEVLPAVIDTATAHKPGQAQIHAEAPGNLCYDWEIGDRAKVDQAFAGAHKTVRLQLVNNRLVPNAIEPRAANAVHDPGTGEYTLHTTSQNPHVARLVISAFMGIAPEHKLRVIAPDVGGGFGSKIFIHAEETVCLWASKKVRRPIKWTAERSESFLSDAHGRDHVTTAELALDREGKFLAMRVNTIANLGAYLSTFASAIPTYLYATLLAGQYKTPLIYCDVQGVFTNTAPVDAYRGAGRPEATFVVERLVEEAAAALGLPPDEIRRRNFVQPNEFPYNTPVIHQYDCGDFPRALRDAMKLADSAGFERRRAEAKARGKLRGIGYSSYIEACGIAPSAAVGALGGGVGLWESATVRFNPTGNVSVHVGTHAHGQSHETTYAQVVADRLGVPFGNVDIVHGDTARTPFGMGTYGSRSAAVGLSAVCKASDKLIEKGKKIAAHLLEASADDIDFASGKFTVKGTDRAKAMGEIAFAAYVPHNYPKDLEPGFEETAFFDPLNFSFPAGTHIAEVEIDPETGDTDIVNYACVDDFGTLINPMVVEGQVHGGAVQGLGQALLEGCVYDKAGQLVTGSYNDYCMPRADDVPTFKVGMIEVPSPLNPLGVKGCGEAGAIAAPAAVMNAVHDALRPAGVAKVEMPATPLRIWQALRSAGR